jgi:fumarate hydratase class I
MQAEPLKAQLVELIRLTACELAPDVERALVAARDREEGRARSTLDWILRNVREATESSVPMCQDTGTLIFHVDHGPDVRPGSIAGLIREAAAEATRRSYLRPNAVDAISGKNSGDNLGQGAPLVLFHEVGEAGALDVRLMLKGGGSENCGVQYSLPDRSLGAGRDLSGIRKCILNAALRAQGFGCAPGILGVGIGGDRMTSFMESKEQFWRPLDDVHPDPALGALESELVSKINALGIGPMGFGGKTTVLGVKLGVRHRVPASFFVSISYMCWAFRRRAMTVRGDEARYR